MRAKRVLITGGAGFIPSNVIHYLLGSTSYEVVSLDALTYAGNLENLADVMSHERLSFVQGDIRDAATVEEIVREVDVIVHAAANSHVEQSIGRPISLRVPNSFNEVIRAINSGTPVSGNKSAFGATIEKWSRELTGSSVNGNASVPVSATAPTGGGLRALFGV